MKNTIKFLGFIAFVAVIGSLTSCASLLPAPKWDSSVPKADLVVLYYGEQFEVFEVNGESKSIGPVQRGYKGKGDLDKGKKSLRIPPGQTTLKIDFNMGISRSATGLSYDFLPGGHYRLIPSIKEGFTLAELAKGAVGAGEDIWDWKVDKIK